MRTNKELLQIAIDNIELFEIRYCRGLCEYFWTLSDSDIIYTHEYRKLKEIIHDHIKFMKWYDYILGKKVYHRNESEFDIYGYFWKVRELAPRLDYLNYLLKIY